MIQIHPPQRIGNRWRATADVTTQAGEVVSFAVEASDALVQRAISSAKALPGRLGVSFGAAARACSCEGKRAASFGAVEALGRSLVLHEVTKTAADVASSPELEGSSYGLALRALEAAEGGDPVALSALSAVAYGCDAGDPEALDAADAIATVSDAREVVARASAGDPLAQWAISSASSGALEGDPDAADAADAIGAVVGGGRYLGTVDLDHGAPAPSFGASARRSGRRGGGMSPHHRGIAQVFARELAADRARYALGR